MSFITKYLTKTTAVILMAASALLFCACAENADLMTEETLPEYPTMVEKIDTYNNAFSAYLSDESNIINTVYGDGYTPAEVPCYTRYAETPNGEFKSFMLQMEDGETVTVQEYFPIDDSTLFIAVSTVNNTEHIYLVEKYVVVNNTLYSLDEEAQVLVEIEHPDSLNIYLSFAEITELYGNN